MSPSLGPCNTALKRARELALLFCLLVITATGAQPGPANTTQSAELLANDQAKSNDAQVSIDLVPVAEADLDDTPLFLTIRDYEQAVIAAEINEGAYGEGLAEHLLALGKALHTADQHEQALDVLRRAWHVNRINQGLYNLEQLPILDLILQSQAATKDWASVADSYDFVQWVYRRNFDTDDPRLLPVLKKLRTWHLSAYYFDSGRSLTEHFYAADAIYTQALRIVEVETGDPLKAMCFWHATCCVEPDSEAAKQCSKARRSRTAIPSDALQRAGSQPQPYPQSDP